MRKIKAAKRIAACLTALVLTAGALAGCGRDNADVVNREDEKNPGTVTEEEEQGTAMGRFVESKIALYENSLTDWNSRLFRQEDGSLLLADNSGFVLRSTDKGGISLAYTVVRRGQMDYEHGNRPRPDGGGRMDGTDG